MPNETNTPQNEYDLRRAAEASRSIGFFAKAKELQENHPIATNVLKLGAAAAIVGIGGTIITADFTQPTSAQSTAIEHQKLTDAENKSYTDGITEAINAHYDIKSMIGEIDIPEHRTLLDPSVDAVIAYIGKEAYNNNKSQIYDSLRNSTLRFTPQPGDRYAVVETDIDPAKHNGIRYVTVNFSHIHTADGNLIPSPRQTVDPSKQLNNGTVEVDLPTE